MLVTLRSSSAFITTAIRPCFSSLDTPLVGSSMIISLGSSTSAIATSSSLRWPSGSVPARSLRARRQLQQLERGVDLARVDRLRQRPPAAAAR